MPRQFGGTAAAVTSLPQRRNQGTQARQAFGSLG